MSKKNRTKNRTKIQQAAERHIEKRRQKILNRSGEQAMRPVPRSTQQHLNF